MVEVTPVRCPPLDESLKAALARRVAAPAPPLDKAAVRAWLDRHEVEQERKIAAGAQIVREYETCRDPSPPQS